MGGGAVESAFRQGDLTQPDLRLIETLGWDGRNFPRLPLHLARLARAAAAFGWPCDPAQAHQAVAKAAPTGPARMRLTLDPQGRVDVQSAPMPAPAAVWRLALAAQRLDAADPWLGVKSTRRAAYDTARASLPVGVDEAIFANAAGQVCDGTITTVFFDAGRGLCTPPVSAGLLPGILRQEMLEKRLCREADLRADDVPAMRLWVGNSLRGLIPAVWVDAAAIDEPSSGADC